LSSGTADDSTPSLYEQSVNCIACAFSGHTVLPLAFEKFLSMLVSYDWRACHVKLMAIAAIAKGTGNNMLNEIDGTVQ